MCSAAAKRCVRLRRVMCLLRDVCLRHESGTHHITATNGSNITMPRGITSLASSGANITNTLLVWEREIHMSDSKLRDLSMDFSVQIINLVKMLKSKRESTIANQIGRSGTSIGANIYESRYAQGKKDFISKLEIALKEASETGYWLELLYRTEYIDEITYKSLSEQCATIRVMLIASCRTAKSNM